MSILTNYNIDYSGPGVIETYFPGVRVYLESAGTVDPFSGVDIFRGEECFDGSLQGWRRWTRPSPEPPSDPDLNQIIVASLRTKSARISELHDILLDRILQRAGDQPILLVAILRAGVFISSGLAARAHQRLDLDIPVAAVGLFHEAGLDYFALRRALDDFPGHMPVFVDGWTGRGVAVEEIRRAIAAYPENPGNEKGWLVATLVDPGHHGDIWATDHDMLIECAHFSAPEVLGFSRAFIDRPDEIWKAYDYPRDYRNMDLIRTWLEVFNNMSDKNLNQRMNDGYSLCQHRDSDRAQILPDLLAALQSVTGVPSRDWKVNCNEVARTFVNRQPRALLLGLPEEQAPDELPAFLYLAEKKQVPVEYVPWMGEEHNCLAAVRLR